MKRRKELRAEIKHLEEENTVLRHAMMQRVNTFLQAGKFLGFYAIETYLKDDESIVLLERKFFEESVNANQDRQREVVHL